MFTSVVLLGLVLVGIVSGESFLLFGLFCKSFQC